MTSINRPGDSSPFAPPPGGVGKFHSQELTQEAVVVDVITNDDHPEYAPDGYNVGAIQFRALKTDQYRQPGKLNWALPIESNITEYPLKNEIVHIVRSLNRFYYTRKINVTHRVTTHALFGLNEELSPVETKEAQSKTFRTHTSAKKEGTGPKQKYGRYFQEKENVYRLRSDEGDMILEGRSGNSIRFGASWKSDKKTTFSGKTDQAPNLIFRVGPAELTPSVVGQFGLVREDVNKDATSLYMASDQTVPLAYSTIDSEVHGASVEDFPKKLDGNQLIINTDRFVVNTKKDKIMGHSFLGIHWTTNKDFTVDTDRDFKSVISRDFQIKVGRDWVSTVERDQLHKVGRTYDGEAGTRYSIVAPKVYVGLHEGEDEPIAAGALLAKFLEDFIAAFSDSAPALVQITAPPGSPSALNPKILAKLLKLKADVAKGSLASFNSRIAYTKK